MAKPQRNWGDDPYTQKAKREGYFARSVYKLEEIDRREPVLKGKKSILELGAAPGSWSQYCLRRLPEAKITAIDLQPTKLKDKRVSFHQIDIFEDEALAKIGAKKFDLVLSDMAPNTSGNADRDSAFSFNLSERAFQIACSNLQPGGDFITKIFMGGDFEEFAGLIKGHFSKIRRIRPKSVRKQSKEIFFVCKGYLGT